MSQNIVLLKMIPSAGPFVSLSPQNAMVKQYKDLCGWRRHFYSKSVFDRKLYQLYVACAVESNLKTNLLTQYKDPLKKKLVSRHFEKILLQACFNVGLDRNDSSVFLQADKINKLAIELNKIVVAVEPIGIKVYPTKKTEPDQNLPNICKYLLYDIPFSTSLLNKKNIKATLLLKDPTLLDQAKKEFQMIFKSIFNQRKNHDDFTLDMLIGNLLSLYVFFKPKADEKIVIPQKIGNSWKEIEFKIEKIKLTPKTLGSPIYALGLKPITSHGVPILIFKGTTFPQDNGFLTSIIADFTPCHSVGGGLYTYFKENIADWIKKTYSSHNNTPIKIYGQSLGGALAYHTALDNPDMVEIQGYVPPGLMTDKKDAKLHGKIFCHENDFINTLGKHPGGVEYYKVITTATRNKFTSHLRTYGSEDALVLRVNRERENARFIRSFLNILHQIGSFFIYFPTQILRLYFIIFHYLQKRLRHSSGS